MSEFELKIIEHGVVYYSIYIVSIAFVLLILAEAVFDHITRRRPNLRETAANIVIEIGNRFLDKTIVGGVFVIGLLTAQEFAFFNIPTNTGTWVLAVLLADFTYYWMHRLEHEIRILWALHNTHHSSSEYNLTTSFRLSWMESLFEWIFFVPVILVGFDAVQVLGALLIVVVYQTWVHTEKIGSLGYLDKLINTPSFHRVHHGSNPDYIDKNYGGILAIWDHLFGTYQPENEPVVYGISVPLKTSNPFAINFRELLSIARDIRQADSLSAVFGYLFCRPGWAPQHRTPSGKPKDRSK